MSSYPGSDEPILDEETRKQTAEFIRKDREAYIRDEIQESLRKVVLLMVINDEGMGAHIDAACQINRRQIVIEEIKSILKDLESGDVDFVQEAWKSVLENSGITPEGEDMFGFTK